MNGQSHPLSTMKTPRRNRPGRSTSSCGSSDNKHSFQSHAPCWLSWNLACWPRPSLFFSFLGSLDLAVAAVAGRLIGVTSSRWTALSWSRFCRNTTRNSAGMVFLRYERFETWFHQSHFFVCRCFLENVFHWLDLMKHPKSKPLFLFEAHCNQFGQTVSATEMHQSKSSLSCNQPLINYTSSPP